MWKAGNCLMSPIASEMAISHQVTTRVLLGRGKAPLWGLSHDDQNALVPFGVPFPVGPS
jgi:hypothetical protein